MSPKNKAAELADKHNNFLQKNMTCLVYWANAIDSALLAVDEILAMDGIDSIFINADDDVDDDNIVSTLNGKTYWSKVRQELEILKTLQA